MQHNQSRQLRPLTFPQYCYFVSPCLHCLLTILCTGVQGEVFIKGKARKGLLADDKELASQLKVGMVFQNGALFDSLNVKENVGFMLYEHSNLPSERIEVRTSAAQLDLCIDANRAHQACIHLAARPRLVLALTGMIDSCGHVSMLLQHQHAFACTLCISSMQTLAFRVIT